MKTYFSNDMKRFNYLLKEIDVAYHEMSLKLGLSDSAMMILYTICESGGDRCLLQDICQQSGISKQTINSALRKLEAEEIVYLEAEGAKKKNVCLTKKGKKLAECTAVRMIETENDIFASWSKEDVEKYLGLTEKFLDAFKEKTKLL